MTARRLWIVVLVLAALTPLGLWLPERVGAGDAWGEWGAEDLGDRVGFVPRGLAGIADLWRAPLPDYSPAGWDDKPFAAQGVAYVLSALVGVVVTALAIWLLGRWLAAKGEPDAS